MDALANLDHLVWGAPSLEMGIDALERLTGVRAQRGGKHVSGGTANALAALGQRRYLEIIAPDPDADDRNDWAQALARLPAPRSFALCLAPPDGLSLLQRTAAAAGLHAAIESGGRVREDGVRLNWTLFEPIDPVLGGALPFFIDWGAGAHPAETAIGGLTLRGLALAHPEPHRLRTVLQALRIEAEIVPAPQPGWVAEMSTPRGGVVLR